MSIIEKFSGSIKYLKLEWLKGDLTVTQLLDILSLVPCVEHLIFNNCRSKVRTPLPFNKETSEYGTLQLQNLKNLQLWDVGDDFVHVFNSLPVDVLKDLQLYRINVDVLATLFKRQANIKVFNCVPADSRTTTAEDFFDNFQLEELHLKSCIIGNTESFFAKQTKLRSLKLHWVVVDDKFFDIVENGLNELHTFSFYIVGPLSLPANFSVRLSNLNRLKHFSLGFDSGSVDLVRSMATTRSPGITAIRLAFENLELGLIESLAKSVPNLKVLKILARTSPQVSAAIMKHFNFVEVLHIYTDAWPNPLNVKGSNPKLVELFIDFNGLTNDMVKSCIDKLSDIYPNLRILGFNVGGTLITCPILRRIVNGFKRLKHLTLNLDDISLTVDSRESFIRRFNYVECLTGRLSANFAFDSLNVTNEIKERLCNLYGRREFSRLVMESTRKFY